MPERHADPSAEPPPKLVLDSNVVFDWLYFRDPRCAALAQAITQRRVCWIATAAMGDELEHVLERGALGTRWPDGPSAVRHGWQHWASLVDAPAAPAPLAMRCTDADDQKFIDLALGARAVALLSADRAVLRLARRARAHGLAITTASAWRLLPSARSAAAP